VESWFEGSTPDVQEYPNCRATVPQGSADVRLTRHHEVPVITKPHRLYMQDRFLANAGSPGDAMQPHVVRRFNGLHLCIPCKYMDYYSFADTGGMKG